MKLHAAQGFRGTIWDLDVGQPVRRVLWVDCEAGLLEAIALDARGREILLGNGNVMTYQARGRFRYIPQEEPVPAPSRTHLLGGDKCVKCSSPLTLPGEEMCPVCRAKDRNQRVQFARLEPVSPLEIRWCSAYGCTRRAVWSVSDEVLVSPVEQAKVLYERGMMVGRRYRCSQHYQPPRILDAKGERVLDVDHAHGVRPE